MGSLHSITYEAVDLIQKAKLHEDQLAQETAGPNGTQIDSTQPPAPGVAGPSAGYISNAFNAVTASPGAIVRLLGQLVGQGSKAPAIPPAALSSFMAGVGNPAPPASHPIANLASPISQPAGSDSGSRLGNSCDSTGSDFMGQRSNLQAEM